MQKKVVAISRTDGAEGRTVGQLVAERLGFRYIEEEIIAQAAERIGTEPEVVADEERSKGWLERVMEALVKTGGGVAGVGAIPVAQTLEMPRSDELRQLILDAIRETAEGGDVVIVAHAASMALAGRDDLLRVLVTAPPEARAERLSADHQIDGGEAMGMVRRADAARADYLKRFHSLDQELPTHYDLVINTEVLGVDAAADLVVQAARA